MRRTKAWWAALTPDERSHLVYLERHSHGGGKCSYLPDDCSECPGCGEPVLGSGWCGYCYNAWHEYVTKADAALSGEEG